MGGYYYWELEIIRRGWRGFGCCVYKEDFDERERKVGGVKSVIKERKESLVRDGVGRACWSLVVSCVQCLLLNQLSNCGGAYSLCFNI